MNIKAISVTEAARRIMPRSGSSRDLAEALAKVELPDAEAATWHRELKTSHKTLKKPADKWQ